MIRLKGRMERVEKDLGQQPNPEQFRALRLTTHCLLELVHIILRHFLPDVPDQDLEEAVECIVLGLVEGIEKAVGYGARARDEDIIYSSCAWMRTKTLRMLEGLTPGGEDRP